jgi:hypothetical protein
MAEKRKIGSSWQKLTGTGPYDDPTNKSSWSKLTGTGYYAKGQPGYRPASETNNLLGPKRRKRDDISEVAVTAKKRPAPVDELPESAPPKKVVAEAPKPKPKSTPQPARKGPSQMEDFMASLGKDSAVYKRLMRGRGNSDERVAQYKKGGKIDGCAQRGRTKTRYV